ncbi:MAG: hypothetical protein IPQ04_14565 [Saprospiraceae bacterium]|nr:hypothetical protein [Saprospiraceae bacterium]
MVQWPITVTDVSGWVALGGNASDACGDLTISSSDITASSGCNETLTRTYIFKDGCNNTATCDHKITRKISVPIILNCGPNISVSSCSNSNGCFYCIVC